MAAVDSWEPKKCLHGCGFFGAPWTSGLCSRCWRERDKVYLALLPQPCEAAGDTPQAVWWQRSNSVYITILVGCVEEVNAGFETVSSLSVVLKSVERIYAFKGLPLFANCVPGKSYVQRGDRCVSLVLTKQKRKWWDKLCTDATMKRYVKADIVNWQDEDDSDYEESPHAGRNGADADIDDDMEDSHPRFNMWQWCNIMESSAGQRPVSAVFDAIDGSQSSSATPSPIPKEFKNALDSICLTNEWLGSSELLRHLSEIERLFADDPPLRARLMDPDNFDAMAASVVQKAFGLETAEEAKRQSTVIPQDASTLMELPPSTQRPYNTLKDLFDMVQDEGKLRLAFAVQQLLEHAQPDALVAKLSELADRVPRCNSAKKHGYNMIVSHAFHCRQQAMTSSSSNHSSSSGMGLAESVEAARQHVRQCFEDFLDEHKENAFNAAFIEPSRLYFHAIGDTMCLETVRQHGLNWYLVLLHAGLGAVLPFLPDYNDMFEMGTGDFWQGLMPEAWDIFRNPATFGKEFQGMPKFQAVAFGSGQFVQDPTLSCEFPNGVQTRHPRNLAIVLTKDSPQCARVRRDLIVYVERFAYFFSRSFFIRRALEQLNAEVKPEHTGFRKAFAKVFEQFKEQRQSSCNAGSGDSPALACSVDEFCYQDEFFTELNLDHVEELFAWLGFVKPPSPPEMCPICCQERKDVRVLEHWESAGDISEHKMCLACRQDYGKNECPFCKEVLLKDEFLQFISGFAGSVRRNSEEQQRVRSLEQYKAVADRSAELMEKWQLFEMEHEGNPRLVRRVAKLVVEALAPELHLASGNGAVGAEWLRDIAGPITRLHAMIQEKELSVTGTENNAFATAMESIISPYEREPPVDWHCGAWDGHFHGHLYNQVLVAWLCAFRAQVPDTVLRDCVRRVGRGIARCAAWYEDRNLKPGFKHFVAEVVHKEYIVLSHEPCWGSQAEDEVWTTFFSNARIDHNESVTV